MIHRYIAGTLGLLILAITIWSWRRRASDPDQPVVLPTLLLGVVIFQAALGMWTVTLLLKPLVVMGHLLGGFTTLSLLFLLLLIASDRRSTIVKPSFKPWAMLGLIILIMQIALGGWTSTNYAALACTDFPTCHGVWMPETDFSEAFVMWRGIGVNYEFGVLEHPARTAIHLTHRIGALITFVYLLGLAVAMIKQGGMLASASKVMLVLLVTQVALGISNVVFHLPLTVAVLHNLVAALLLLSVIYVNYVLWRRQY
jgi:cytochrome c oxidase assembly protein subunit 15